MAIRSGIGFPKQADVSFATGASGRESFTMITTTVSIGFNGSFDVIYKF